MTELNADNFEKSIICQNLVIVDFMADWCSPCRHLKPVLQDLENEYTSIKFFKVDIDKSMELAKKYGVFSVPTLIFFKNGENIRQFSGVRSKDFLKENISELM